MSKPDLTTEQWREYEEWVQSRPVVIQNMLDRAPPWEWYRLTTDSDPTRTAYQILAYHEDETVRVRRFGIATGQPLWDAFGISVDDLVVCDDPDTQRAGWTAERIFVETAVDAMQLERLRAALTPDAVSSPPPHALD